MEFMGQSFNRSEIRIIGLHACHANQWEEEYELD